MNKTTEDQWTHQLREINTFLHAGKKFQHTITETCLCNLASPPPRKKWGLQGYTLFFLFLLWNIDCGYPLEPPQRGGSNEYPQSLFRAKITKRSHFFHLKLFVFAAIKSVIILNGRIFVMRHIYLFSYFLENILWHFMQIVSFTRNVEFCFLGKNKKNINWSSAESARLIVCWISPDNGKG